RSRAFGKDAPAWPKSQQTQVLRIRVTCRAGSAAFMAPHLPNLAPDRFAKPQESSRKAVRCSVNRASCGAPDTGAGRRSGEQNMTESASRSLSQLLPGQVSLPGDDRYTAATRIWTKPFGAM